MRKHLGVWGKAPAGVQRAEPSGARRKGGPSGEERESRGQSPLVPDAKAAPPARSGSPEGRALWRLEEGEKVWLRIINLRILCILISILLPLSWSVK